MKPWMLALVFAAALAGVFQFDGNVRQWERDRIMGLHAFCFRDAVTGKISGIVGAPDGNGHLVPFLGDGPCPCIVGDSSSSSSQSSSSGSSSSSSGWPGTGWYCIGYVGNGSPEGCDCSILDELCVTHSSYYVDTQEQWDGYQFGTCQCEFNGFIYSFWRYTTDAVRYNTKEECDAICPGVVCP